MKRCIGLLGVFVLAVPLGATAAEPAWWTQQKRNCGLSSGLAYNTWVAQGSPCNSGSSKSSSSSSPGGSIGTVIGTEIGKELNKMLWGDPAAEARRKTEEAQRAEELRRTNEEALRRAEETKGRLLGGMLGVDGSQPLGLMGVEPRSELSLMTDSASVVAPTAKVVSPPVTKKSTSFTKGFEHASQCISQNSGSACAGVTADQQQACVADYRGGYDSGSIQRKLVLQEAYQAGEGARARGELANGPSDPRALGPCRTDWVMAYNNGYGVKAPPLPATKPALANAPKAVGTVATKPSGAVVAKAAETAVAKDEPEAARSVQGARPASTSAAGNDPPAVIKTIAALDCAVNSVLAEYKAARGSDSIDAESLRADLATIKNILRIPPSGKKGSHQVQTISLSQQSAVKAGEKQVVGSILVVRNEETGEVKIDVSQSVKKDTSVLASNSANSIPAIESQNIIVLDRTGKILDKEVTGSVSKCLGTK